MNRSLLRSRPFFLKALGVIAIPAGCPSIARGADTYTFRMAITEQAMDPVTQAGVRFATGAARRSNGRLKIEVYPNGQLVNQADTTNSLANGVIDFTINTTTFMLDLIPQYQVLDAPFLFRNIAAVHRLFDGPLGKELFAILEPKGLVGLGWGTIGFRQIMTVSKPVVAPEDLKGLRMRIPTGAVYTAMYQALGSIPIAIDNSELFVALTQHTIEGIDFSVSGFATRKFYTLMKHMTLTNHSLIAYVIAGNKRRLDGLPPDLQKIVREEARAAGPFIAIGSQAKLAADLQLLQQNGVTTTSIQYPAFRRLMDPVYALIQSKVGGDLLDRAARVGNAG